MSPEYGSPPLSITVPKTSAFPVPKTSAGTM